jgi:hypothetical protein
MVPLDAGVRAADHDPLAGEPHCPDLGGADVDDARLDRLGSELPVARGILRGHLPLDLEVQNRRIALDAGDLGAGRDLLGVLDRARHPNRIHDVERLVVNAPQP